MESSLGDKCTHQIKLLLEQNKVQHAFQNKNIKTISRTVAITASDDLIITTTNSGRYSSMNTFISLSDVGMEQTNAIQKREYTQT